jgi:hypothetical protein
MDPNLVDYCYQTQSIKTVDWMRILENIILESEYYVYRRSYWGENAGNMVISSLKTVTMVLVRVISGDNEEEQVISGDNEEETISLISPIRSIKKRVNLLIENNNISIINKIIPAYFVNNSYLLNSTENILI